MTTEMEHLRHKLMRADAGFAFDRPTFEECQQLLAEYDQLSAAELSGLETETIFSIRLWGGRRLYLTRMMWPGKPNKMRIHVTRVNA